MNEILKTTNKLFDYLYGNEKLTDKQLYELNWIIGQFDAVKHNFIEEAGSDTDDIDWIAANIMDAIITDLKSFGYDKERVNSNWWKKRSLEIDKYLNNDEKGLGI